jgi:hypothetical protein
MKPTVIMSTQPSFVNAHEVNADRLTRIDDRILSDLIALRRVGAVPSSRLQLAGVPPLVVLETERRRREGLHVEAAS